MPYAHKPGSFSLFKNDKGGNDKRPDYRGEGKDLAGNDIEVAAWLRESPKGKFMSCNFKLKEAREDRPSPADNPRTPKPADLSDDVPF